jgi:hypothetical protein
VHTEKKFKLSSNPSLGPLTADRLNLITPSRNSAEFTLPLSSSRFHERYCWPNPRQQKALENIMFSRA